MSLTGYLESQENRLLASAKYIIRRLEECGYEAYIVGGCVRDSILGTAPHDYDICTSALPHEVMSAFDKSIVILLITMIFWRYKGNEMDVKP